MMNRRFPGQALGVDNVPDECQGEGRNLVQSPTKLSIVHPWGRRAWRREKLFNSLLEQGLRHVRSQIHRHPDHQHPRQHLGQGAVARV